MAETSATIRGRARWRRMLVAVATIALLAGYASACGLEGDDITLQRVALNVIYPDALHVLGAVSSARLSRRLDRTLGIDSTLTVEDLRRVMARISAGLWKLHARLASDAPAKPPALSIVLLEPMLWSRIAAEGEMLKLEVHLDGPTRGDVVAVTEEPVIVAMNSGTLSARDALSLGLLRLYGSASDVASVRSWLWRGDPK
ncbi:MAG TPA: hypothetical protein VK473_07885 [Terriglobales bacterium]|nr:hypothetical protein [Terriglobales bacterium]